MKILVVDDHPLILGALAALLPQLGSGIVVRAAARAEEAVAILDGEPDVALVLLDLGLPGARGQDLLADFLLDYPGVPIVILSATDDHATVSAALAAGARGFIAKTASAPALLEALRQVIDGAVCRAGDRTVPVAVPVPVAGPGTRPGAPVPGLTARQGDVLRLIAQGKPNKIICRDLRLSEGTVKVHVSAVLRALNVGSRTQAVAELARRGIHADTLPRSC
jgi:DNA-binding NarL/FixJ family response regulator